MLTWLKKMFRRDSAANQCSPARKKPRKKSKGRRKQPVSILSCDVIDAYERSQSRLNDEDEAIATELIIASHNKDIEKDIEKIKNIGRQLNDFGGIERMKLLCYRVRHRGGDDRWIEMMWSGIGDWQG